MESTKMSFPKISNFTAIVDEFEYSSTEKITYLFPMVIIIIFGIKIHLQLLQYLRLKTGSYVNQVIGFQTYTNLYLIPFVVIFGALRRWISDTLSPDMTLICYTYSYLAEFLTISIQNHSFFVTLFRYLCIVETDFMWSFFGVNAPKKLTKIIPYFELLFTAIVTLAMWFPTSPSTSSTLLSCLGRNEVYFDFDYFVKGGHSRTKEYCQIQSILGRYTCYATLGIELLVASNVLDFLLVKKILQVMKLQTQSVASMISPESLSSRQRDDSIVMSIAYWQWFVEFLFNIGMVIFHLSIRGDQRRIDHWIGIAMFFFGFVLLPSFYFLADVKFRRALDQKGLKQALWLALTQSYQ